MLKILKSIYKDLKLEAYETVEKDLHEYIDSKRNYQTNPFNKDNLNIKIINKKMRFFFNHYGYDVEN